MNQWTVCGNLTQTAELRYTGNGVPILNGCIACNEYGSKDDTGKTRKYTEFVHFVMFGQLAESQARHFQKGRLLMLRGRAHTERWEQDGQKHYRIKLLVGDIEYLHSANGEENREKTSWGSLRDRFAPPEDDIAAPEEEKPPLDNTDDDLPF